MKKVSLLLALLALLFCSCEENINYLGEFKEQYSLNCVLRSDSDIQLATIKRSYPPGEGNQNYDVRNAAIKLILPDTTLFFKDTVLSEPLPDNILVNSFYYLDNYSVTKNTEIKIEALLPDGNHLTSETTTPYYFVLNLVDETAGRTIPDENSSGTYFYNWEISGNYAPVIFGPSFYISYFISGEEEIIRYKKVIGNYLRQLERYEVPFAFINETMQDISVGIDDKSRINILGACFEVKVFDIALGVYVNSIQTFEDEFGVRISEPNISNINGGFGIFGSYISEKFEIELTSDYIYSFGYTPVSPPQN